MRYLFALTLFFLSSCSVLSTWQLKHPDNLIEEIAEDYIESVTGIENIDLTPFTGEETIFNIKSKENL